MIRSAFIAIALIVSAAGHAVAIDYVSIRRDSLDMHLAGNVIVEAHDGGLLLMQPDGVLWAVQPDEITLHTSDTKPFTPLTADELAEQLLHELPAGFKTHRTANYVFCYDTSTAYARWNGALYERLYRAFYNFWEKQGWELQPPSLPLCAVIFQSKADYVRYARAELGDAAESVVGYYSLRTNRVVMYDLTEADGQLGGRPSGKNIARINAMLSSPAAGSNVATVIHEATHQLAFNSGMQVRYADIPLWVSEGLAMYFETPDLAASRGWRTIGAVNRPRLMQFRGDLSSREGGSFLSLIATDSRFRQTDTAIGAYAEAWALNYYLMRKRPKQYLTYLRSLSQKKPLLRDTPTQRQNEFRRAMNLDFNAIDADFVRYMREVR